MFPNDESLIRRLASLHRVRADGVPRFRWYYQDATTSCRPFRRTSSPSLGGTAVRIWLVRYPRIQMQTTRTWSWSPGAPAGIYRGDDRISQVPGEPAALFARVLRPRRDRDVRPLSTSRRGPRLIHGEGYPRSSLFRGSIARLSGLLSTLRRNSHLLPRKTRFRPLVRLYRTGLVARRVPTKGFKLTSCLLSPFPKLLGASTTKVKPHPTLQDTTIPR